MQSCIGRGRSVESVLFVLQARIYEIKHKKFKKNSLIDYNGILFTENNYIYDYEDELSFVEMRKLQMDEDSKHQGGKVIKTCSDCDVLICVQYGFKSKIKADDAGLKLVMDEGPIDEVLKRYTDHVDFMKNQSII